jgi:exopolysaccharide biosynthesis polyprenyl glycosylphosphotransferase
MIRAREYRFKLLLMVSDAIALTAAYALALWLRFDLLADVLPRKDDVLLQPYGWTLAVILLCWLVIFRAVALYNIRLRGLDELFRVFKGVFFGTVLVLSLAFFYRKFTYSRIVLMFFVPGSVFCVFMLRNVLRFLRQHLVSQAGGVTNVLIVGNNPVGAALANGLTGRDIGYRIIGCVDESGPGRAETSLPKTIPILGAVTELDRIVRETSADELWIAAPASPRETLEQIVEAAIRNRISIKLVPDACGMLLDWVHVDSLGGIPLIGMRRSNITGLNAAMKRLTDLVYASALLAMTSPVMVAAAVLIKATSRGPVFFRQARIGKNGRTFTFLKFRSMYTKTGDAVHRDFTRNWIEEGGSDGNAPSKLLGTAPPENAGQDGKKVYKIQEDPRITPVGRFIRKFSIDELPQLLCVLKGDMSLIGPRPPIPYEVEHYREWHKQRLETRPGITGLWQVRGRNLLSFDDMVRLDIEYIQEWSFLLDIKIILKTISVVLLGKGY